MTDSELITLTNGTFGADLSPLDRGLAYGDGLFETCRVYAGRVPLWSLHRDRLMASALKLGIPLDIEQIELQRQQILSRAPGADGVLKLLVTRGPGGRAYLPPEQPLVSYCWQLLPGARPAWQSGQNGIVLYECAHRLGDNPALAGMKHLNRLEYVLARMEWGEDYPEGLLMDVHERVIEGTLSNVFIRRQDGWRTPRLNRNGVAGVMRRLILEQLAPALELNVVEGEITRADLVGAKECFVCNSVFGIWPVIGLAGGGESFQIGPETRQLQQRLAEWLGAENIEETE